jgi:hypothetical protein
VTRRSAMPAWIAWALAAWLAAPRSAHAERDVLVVGGGATDHGQLAAVRGAIENTLRKAGWSWPARPPSPKEADSLLRCEDSRSPWTCIPATISGLRASDVQRVFVLSIESRTAPEQMLVLTGRVIVASSPPAFVVRQRFCEQCSTGQLVQASEELTRQLFSDLDARATATAISVTSEPPGADIRLDGSPAGTTPARLSTTPGKHLVTVTRAGFVYEVRTIGIEPGQTLAVGFTLHAASSTGAPPGPQPPGSPEATEPAESRSFRRVPAAVIAAGAGLVAFGGVALYLGHLGGPTDRYRYTRATPVGVTSLVLGLGAVGAGLYLWRGPDGSGLFAAADRHGSLVVWSGRF